MGEGWGREKEKENEREREMERAREREMERERAMMREREMMRVWERERELRFRVVDILGGEGDDEGVEEGIEV